MIDLQSLRHALGLIPCFLRLARRTPDKSSAFFRAWPDLQHASVVREEFLETLCRGKRVLHFGFVDAPFSAERIRNGRLLHQRLQKVAAHVFGLDIDAASLETYRSLTGDQENAIVDITAPLPDLPQLAGRYDLILFPEVLEHILKPAEAMANLHQLCRMNPGSRLCITTPNAYSVMGFFTALSGDELVHPDHYFYFSPSTLAKLLRDTGFTNVEMKLYADAGLLRSPGLTKHGLIALCSPN